jgi:hypothetical protein
VLVALLVCKIFPPVIVRPDEVAMNPGADTPVYIVEVPTLKLATLLIEKMEPGDEVPIPILLLPPIKNAGVEVPLSATTNAGVVEPISTERVAHGVVEAMPIAPLPKPPEPSEVEKIVSSGFPSIWAE